MNQSEDGSIAIENATILSHLAYPGEQYVLRLHAPLTAASAEPGSFVHLRCTDSLALRRPLSIMRVDASSGWIELLYRVVGQGTTLLANAVAGQTLSLLGPIGQPFSLPSKARRQPLLIGGGVGIPPMIFLADLMRKEKHLQPLVLMGSETPFPFPPKPSTILIAGMPDGVIASMPLLEEWGIASRLASCQDFHGCYDGYVTDLGQQWLSAMNPSKQQEVCIYACGPWPMLAAAAALARRFDIPCQVSLEEHMACAVGGCAGCTVPITSACGDITMKRVCVDGPVFDAYDVFPATEF